MADKVTIADVARRAGVSRQTVSNALNTPAIVREETRRRVLDAVEELGYRVNQAARQMRTGRSRLIAIRIEPDRDGVNGSVLDRFLHGLTESAARAGYRVLLYTAADDMAELGTFDDLLGAYEPDGFVLTCTHHDDLRTSWLRERKVPFVTFGRPWGDLDGPGHPWVDVDGAAGTAAATRHLLAKGHRVIGFLGWPSGSDVGDDRRAGWERALAAAGLDPEGLSRAVHDDAADGERAARDLLAANAEVTALVCASDSLALGALEASRSARTGDGAGRPTAVIGFDDTPVARAVGLTSVSQPLPRAAAACVALLARLIDGHAPDGRAPATGLITPNGWATSNGPGAPDDRAASDGRGARVLLEPALVVRRSA